MRDIAINLRALASQRDLIDRAANQLGRTRSDFLLEAACEKAQNVLLDQSFFSVDDKAFARFVALCDAPLVPNPALERLLATPSPWEVPPQKVALKTKRTVRPMLPVRSRAKISKSVLAV
jgi:uncharacterized protein (DUF1778 family)